MCSSFSTSANGHTATLLGLKLKIPAAKKKGSLFPLSNLPHTNNISPQTLQDPASVKRVWWCILKWISSHKMLTAIPQDAAQLRRVTRSVSHQKGQEDDENDPLTDLEELASWHVASSSGNHQATKPQTVPIGCVSMFLQILSIFLTPITTCCLS